jgi:tetratricopeptide (TPR) repeat protein
MTFCVVVTCARGAGAAAFPAFDLDSAREYLSSMAAEAPVQAGTNAATCLIVARVEQELGRVDVAESWARKGLALDPRSAEAKWFLARLWIREDRTEEAIACLREVVQLDASRSAAYRLLGMALERAGDTRGAEEALVNGLRLNPADAEAGVILGRLLLQQGRTREAVTQLEKACQSDPGSANGFYVLYQAQTSAGDAGGAQKSMQRFQALKKREQDGMSGVEARHSDDTKLRACAAEFHNGMALVFQQAGRMGEAEGQLRQAVRVAPEEQLAYQRLAALCARTGRLREAEEFFATLERLQPAQASYAVNRGILLLQLKDYAGAVQQFELVLQKEPNQPEALNHLARYFLSTRQRLPEALTLSRRLVEARPEAAHYDLLGWALYTNGRTNEAIEACRQAIQRDPGNAAYQERRRKLEQTLHNTQ